MCGMWFFGSIAFAFMAYYGAILLGFYKDPMMAHFRVYGEERRIYPLSRFVGTLGIVLFIVGLGIPVEGFGVVTVTLGVLCFIFGWIVSRIQRLQTSLPVWYDHLHQITTREERRAIAFAWVRLPLRTRLRLNGDGYAFRVFVDEVRLTVIYGARDPDDPWEEWQ